MPLTKQQAETVADSLLAGAGGADASEQSNTVKSVPWIYRSEASRRLDRQQEWLAYREVTRQPFNRHPVFIGVMFICIAAVLLLFWAGGHRLSGWEFVLAMALLLVPHIVRVVLARAALARAASGRV